MNNKNYSENNSESYTLLVRIIVRIYFISESINENISEVMAVCYIWSVRMRLRYTEAKNEVLTELRSV